MRVLNAIAAAQPVLVQLVNETALSPELVVSALALVISVASIVMQWTSSRKNVKINLEAEYFSKIYQEYLMEKIPKARQKIGYNNRVLNGIDELTQVLNDMRRASLFFKYQDSEFYSIICKKLQSLEDDLIQKSGEMPDEEYAAFVVELNTSIEEIYDTINRRYLGKKTKKSR